MPTPASPARARVATIVESRTFQNTITTLILVNAVVLGLETYPAVMDRFGGVIVAFNWFVVGVFTVEIVLRLVAYGWSFFRDGWSVFDFIIVAVSYVPALPGMQVVRVLRVLRVLRLLSQVHSMRRVVGALLSAIPGIASIAGLLVIIGYVFVIVSTTLFGSIRPDHFGDLARSGISLFRLLIGDGWFDIVMPLAEQEPVAWPFFILYTIVSTFVVLNLFIAVTTEALSTQRDEEQAAAATDVAGADANTSARDAAAERDDLLLTEIRALRDEVTRLREAQELARTRAAGTDDAGH
ncbi:ion transporter [Pseudoclavibacter chungangensis]|uniref:Ion transporter n=1 Tax=Pseudoclavibacter chungangensis TaxID=587635 RepID=A0A7J5BSN1_9MICO|nr:ion transporter [Pseudoclavibacter chungangensis]KAB1655974.1 ion transporter [Pseudoclavibacter chungangensis]NYJ66421.1 voltage-gated sodium channel [Pseudoclavibacter chungangensis]